MLALDDQALARLCISATAIAPEQRERWLRDLADRVDPPMVPPSRPAGALAPRARTPAARRQARVRQRRKSGVHVYKLELADRATEGLIMKFITTYAAIAETTATEIEARRVQLVHLASHHRLPATYASRAYPDIGGLMSYGASLVDAYRHIGVYTGRILKGAKPADLPVVQRGNAYEKCPSNGHFFRRVQKMRDIAGWIAAGCANGPASVTQSLSAPPYSSSSPHATNVRINSATVVPRRLAMAFSI